MSEIIDNLTSNEIDVTKINWNKLTIKEYQVLEEQFQARNLTIKKQKTRKPKSIGSIVVQLRGQKYNINKAVYEKLKNMKADKCKEKLIDKIISETAPIMEL